MSAADDYKRRMEAILNEGCSGINPVTTWDYLQSEEYKDLINKELQSSLDECEITEEPQKKQVGGSHYQVAAIQPWDIMAAYGLDPWSANVVKYILRFPYKAGRQDLEKAQHYIEYLITHYDEVKDTYYD